MSVDAQKNPWDPIVIAFAAASGETLRNLLRISAQGSIEDSLEESLSILIWDSLSGSLWESLGNRLQWSIHAG